MGGRPLYTVPTAFILSLYQACIFRRSYFSGQFLPSLLSYAKSLTEGLDSSSLKETIGLIKALKAKDKIPNNMHKEFAPFLE